MVDMEIVLARWHLDASQVQNNVYRAPMPRERERWHALWLLARAWSAAANMVWILSYRAEWSGRPIISCRKPTSLAMRCATIPSSPACGSTATW